MKSDFTFTDADSTYLKEAYPLLQHRKKYAEKKMTGSRLKHPAVVRIEPFKGDIGKIQVRKYITLMMEGNTKLLQIVGYMHKKLKLEQKSAVYLYVNGQLLNHASKIDSLKKDEDGIVYIQYVGDKPFGK